MPPVKVIFFDAGGTLFRPYPSVGEIYSRTAARHGVTVTPEELERLFHDAWHARNGLASLTGATSDKIERDWWQSLVKEVFAATPFQDFEAFFGELYELFARPECWRLFDDALPILEELREKNYRLGIISNWDHRLYSIVEGLGIAGFFQEVTASSAVGVPKPGKGIFERALKALQIDPAAALHVGDSIEEDYHGARNAGLRAVLLDRHRKAYNGVIRIETLKELTPLLT